jgi:hypothetical protein
MLKTLWSWSIVLSPGKSGFSVNSYTITQANAKISIAVVDFLRPIKFSGERYHLVAT